MQVRSLPEVSEHHFVTIKTLIGECRWDYIANAGVAGSNPAGAQVP